MKIVVFLLGILSGLVVAGMFFALLVNQGKIGLTNPGKTVQEDKSPTQSSSAWPVSPLLLTNPAVYQWRGSIQGRIIEKNANTFTVEDDKLNRITVTDRLPTGENYIITFDKIEGRTVNRQSLELVKVGTKIRGDFFVFKGGNHSPVGGNYTIIDEE